MKFGHHYRFHKRTPEKSLLTSYSLRPLRPVSCYFHGFLYTLKEVVEWDVVGIVTID